MVKELFFVCGIEMLFSYDLMNLEIGKWGYFIFD